MLYVGINDIIVGWKLEMMELCFRNFKKFESIIEKQKMLLLFKVIRDIYFNLKYYYVIFKFT